MAYSKTTWADGDVITAAKLNNAENGIEANAAAITAADAAIAAIAADVAESATVTNGSIVFKNGSGTTLFSVALPVYNGGVA